MRRIKTVVRELSVLLLMGVSLAVVCQMGAHAVFNMCIGHVNPLYVSTWETADPVFCILIAVVTLGQVPKGYEIIGCIVVVAALLFYNYQESKES
ncbi:MAG: DMT family transporter [Firmicutes bacterium]|nr:DMT family transporter [Bacillota bacterium]